jgi:hypothetical protein
MAFQISESSLPEIVLARGLFPPARAGQPARIIAKVNSLIDAAVIKELYDASQAGVQIDLIVRGMCSLRPGLHGVSRHSRAFRLSIDILNMRDLLLQNGVTTSSARIRGLDAAQFRSPHRIAFPSSIHVYGQS